MKKMFFAMLFACALLVGCTDLTAEDETIFETQATDKFCASNPGAPGCPCQDPTDPACND